MKKILSILMIAAMLLAALCVSVAAGAYFDRTGTDAISYKDAKFQVRVSDNVVIDGVITPGEYDAFIGRCEWWIGEMASDAFDDAQKMADTVKWYFSWDGNKYFNVAAVFDAGVGAVQNHPGGDFFGDYNKKETDPSYEMVRADYFLGWGPGMQIVSNETSAKYEDWARFCFAVGKSDVDGKYISGTYSDQNGQPGSNYAPVGGQDYAVSKNGTVVTIEWKVPIYQLKADFVEGSTKTNFKCSITVCAGLFNSDLAAELESTDAASYNYGVRLGMQGFNADSTLEDMGHATFILTRRAYVQIEDREPKYTIEPPVTDEPGETTEPIETTVPGQTTVPEIITDEPTLAPESGSASEDNSNADNNVTVNTGAENVGGTTGNGIANNGAANNGVANKPTNNQNASVTADPMIIAAVVSALSACGVMIAKKRK